MLPSGNTAYLNLLNGIDLDNEVTLGLICELLIWFDLLSEDQDRTPNRADFKGSIASELAGHNLHDMYFCLQLD